MAASRSLSPLPRVELSMRRRLSYAAHGLKAVTQQHHRELAPHFASLFPRDGVVFDVGAHAGQFTRLFARLAPEGCVYSFEPGSYARSVLLLALALNRVANVRAFPVGFSDRPGQMELHMLIKASGSFGFGLSHLGTAGGERPAVLERIDLVTLDGFCGTLSPARLDFIKADIEGWELRMLEGGRETLARYRPNLWIEMVDASLVRAGGSLRAAWTFLTAQGYRPFEMCEGGRFATIDSPVEGDITWVPEERAEALPR